MYTRAEEISWPHSGYGGWTPSPRKLREAAIVMALPTPMVTWTMIGLRTLGRICRRMMRESLASMAKAASTNSWPRMDRMGARTAWAYRGMVAMVTAMMAPWIPGPIMVEMTMASSIWGSAIKMSKNRIIRLSTFPP